MRSPNRLLLLLLLAFMAVACEQEYPQGQALYTAYCANCHMDDGSGLAGVIPPLQHADYLRSQADQLPCVIVNGLEGPITVNGQVYNQPMAAIEGLSETELANILNYIQYRWGDPAEFYSIDRIRTALDDCP